MKVQNTILYLKPLILKYNLHKELFSVVKFKSGCSTVTYLIFNVRVLQYKVSMPRQLAKEQSIGQRLVYMV